MVNWTKTDRRHGTTHYAVVAGVFHCYVRGNGGCIEMDFQEPERFNWYIAPDGEDKNYRRAIAEGCADTAATAQRAVVHALEKVAISLMQAVYE